MTSSVRLAVTFGSGLVLSTAVWVMAAEGAVEDTVTVDPPPLDEGLPLLRDDLQNALVEQGLFPREAQAMVETWQDSWFEDGARLIFIVPRRAVDAILPLRIEPAPSQVARVSLGGLNW